MALQGALLGVIILLSGQFCSMSRAETNVCKTYGSGVIQSFSKTLFYLKSTCPVTLTRFTLLGVNCDVTVQRGSTGLMTRVEILVNKVTTVLQDGRVTVEGNSISLPFEHTYQHVYQYGVYIKLRSKVLPFSITWRNHSEGVSSLWMQLDNPLVDGMTGMCGLKNSATLGQFISTNVISDGKCITEDSLKPPQPSAVCEVLSYAIGCPTSAITYLGLCSLSMFKNINVDAKCAFFEEVARWCGNQSRLWPVWRQKTSCKPPTCPGDLKYQELGPPFAPTCTSPQPPSDILISTCLPPPGTVLNDRAEGYHCVTVKDCPCVYGGKTYPPGAQRNSKCQSCVCVQGKWTCSANVCPPTCNIEGQFVTTFDGKQYSVPGKCTYVAARGFKWKVAVKFSDTDASIAEMYLEVYQEKYTFSSHSVKLGQDEITDLSQTDYTTVFWQSSMFVQVQTSFGMKMKVQVFPEIQLYLYLPPTEKTTGLCGTYNNDTEDDFTTSSGIVENAVLPFSQSWTMGGCSPPDSSICINTEKEIFAEEKCSLLRNTSSVFARCHDYVPVSMFFDACVHRTCQCTSGLKDCLCVALSNYVKACASQGINIGDWRAETDCNIVCNGNLRFSYNMQACNQTCRSLTGRDPTCVVQVDPVEGCGCMPGTHLNTPQECSPSTLCMCHYQGGSTRPGPVTIDGRECMCENGNLSCSPICDCPGGKLCVHCAQAKVNTAQKTCESLSKPFSVDENCTSGCYCPAGLFEDHNGTCVTQENCTCEFSGSVYASGQSVETNCKKCICRGGQWYCEGEPCPGVCEVFGNGQYNTFDSMWYRFDGNCQYTLVEDATGDGHRQFAVRVESVPCCDEALTCSRAISVDLQDVVTLILRDMNVTQTLKAGWQLQAQPLYSIHTVGLHIIISVPDLGLTVIWDKNTRVKIKLQARWKGKVRGLCGNFDGKVMNDLLTSSSSVVFSTLEFGNSWKTAVPPCSDVTQEVFPCERHSYCEAWAQRRCMILQSDTFRDCHLKVDPTHYYQACILESCSCEFEGRFLGFCTAVAAYAEACTAQNVCIKWRTPDLCPVYCDYYNEESKYGWHYEPCGQIETCGKKHRLTGRLEGCYPKCSAEMPYFDENTRKCSTLDNCTCFFNNTVIRPGDKVTTYKECCECIGGQIICGDCATPTPAKKIIIYTTGTTTTTTTEIPSTTGKTKPATSLITATSRTTVIKRTTETPGMTKQTETTNKRETTLTTTSTTEKTATTEQIVPTTVQTTTIPETTVTITTSIIPGTTGRTETTTTLETTVATTLMRETPGTTEKTEPITPQTTSIPETTVTTTTSEIPGTTEGSETTTSQTTTIPETPETTVTTTTSEIPGTTEETETTTSQTTTIPETPETTVTTTTSEIPSTTEETETTTSQSTTIPETPETTVTTTTSEIPGTTEETETTTSQTTTIPETPETTVTTTTSEIPSTTEETETTTSQSTTIPETPETTVTTTTSEIPGTTEGTETTTSQTTTIPETPETTVTTTTSEKPSTTEETETTTSQTTTIPETPETTVTTTTSEIPGTTEGTETTTSQTTTIPETTVTTTTSEIPGTTEGTETTTSQTTTIPETTVTTTTSEIPGTTEGTETTTSQTTTIPETPETTVTTTTSEIPGTTEGTETTTSQTTTIPETPETTVTTTTSEIPGTTEGTETTTSQTTTIPETTVTTTTSEIPGTTEGTETTTSQTTTIPETTVTTTTSEIPGTTEGTETTTSQTTTIPETPETTVTTTTSEIPGTTEVTETTTSQTTTIPETPETTVTTTSEIPGTTEVTETTTSQTTTIPETPETTVTTTTSEIPGTTEGTETTTSQTTTIPETPETTVTTTSEIPGTTEGTETTTSQTTTIPETTVTTTTSEIPSTTEETETTTSQTTTIPETPETTVTTTTSEIPGTTEGTETTTSQTTTIPDTTVTTTTSEIPSTTEETETTTSQTTTIPETPETTVTTTTSEIPGTTEGIKTTTLQTTTIPETTVTTTTSEIPSTTEETETTTSQTTTIPEKPETTVTIITSKVPGTAEGTETTTIPKTMVTTTPMTETPGTTKGTESTPLVLTLPPVSTKSPYTSGQQSVVTTLPVTSTQYTTVGFCRDPLRNQTWPSGAEWKEDCFYKTCRNGTIEMRPVTCPALVPPVCREDLMRVVKNEEGCCEIWQCDCQCELYGDPHYISFSGTTFDFLENCTYTLMKEKIPRHHLSIAVDNYYSTSLLFGSSVKGVVLKYQNDTITLQFNTDNYTVEATMNGILVQPPYKENGIRFESTNFKVFVYIDKIRSHISFDPDNTLQITLAMEHFRDNTVGQCGVCGGPSCVRRNGRAESDDCCNMTAYDWVEKDPLKPHCDYVPKDLPCVPVTPPPPPPPCVAPLCDLLRHEVFHECTRSLDVETLVTNCRFDYCMVNRNMSICSPLQHLSERCKRLGFCVHWRNLTMGACDVTCPGGMIFDECRSTPDDVCQSGLRVQGKFGTDSMRSGCFCPGNTWLADEHKTFCVSECTNCKGPLGEPMLAGAVWESNCHICTCNNQTLTEECIPMPPAPDPICGADSMLVSGCCGNQICVEKTCEYNGQKYKVGDTWTDHSRPCVSFSCTSAGTEIERRVCPEQSCSEELRVWDEHHCCYSCNVTCAVRITKMTIKVDDCSQEVELPNCEGYCPSKSLMVRSGKILQLEQERRCCREKNYEIRRLSLSCKGATPNHYTYNHITSCDCLPDA